MLWSRSRPQERLRFQWMFIWMIPPQLPNLLTPNVVWWCIIMGQNVTQADWFAVFKFKVTARAHLIRYDCFCHVSWTADLLATKVNWMVHHHKLEWFVYKLDICFQGQGHSESSELYWIFMYLASSAPLISWQSSCTDLRGSDSSTLTYTITRHTMGVGGILPHKATNIVLCWHNAPAP